MQRKSGAKPNKDSIGRAAEVLSYGGRAGEAELKEIASMSVMDMLESGLTLEQAHTVMKMAALEISRIANEAQWGPRTPAIEVKIKKGKK